MSVFKQWGRLYKPGYPLADRIRDPMLSTQPNQQEFEL